MACLNYNLRSLQANFSGGRTSVRNDRSGCAGRVKLLGPGLYQLTPLVSPVFFCFQIKEDAPSCSENTPAMYAV